MIVYNVTIKINHEVHEDWLEWMKSVHIPDVMDTGYFTGHKMMKLLKEDEDGITYAIQYYCAEMRDLHQYQIKEAARLQAFHTARYKDKYVAFRTLLEVVSEE